jgi:PKHD-type hydroxylase
MSYSITNSDNFYQIPSGLPELVLDSLIQQCEEAEDNLFDAAVYMGDAPRKKPTTDAEEKEKIITTVESVRKSKIYWIPTDHWIAGVMAHWVLEANRNLYGFDLTCWTDRIQYTVYGKTSHYRWHNDSVPNDLFPDLTRKLSISFILSDPDEYEGGEFQLMNNNALMTYKPPKGTAIIFPSTVTHRVRPVKSGVRKSLVGWYSGPHWK